MYGEIQEQLAKAREAEAARGGDLYHRDMGDISGGTVKFGPDGTDHISVYSKSATARMSWDVKDGEVTADQKGYEGPHAYDQNPGGGPF